MSPAEAARMAELEARVAFLSEVVAAAYIAEGAPVPPELAEFAPPPVPRLSVVGGAS